MNKNENTYWNFISFKKFYLKNKTSLWILGMALIIAYGIKIFNISISHDTEAIMSVPDSLYGSWYSLGRFGLIFLKKLLGTYTFNPFIASLFMVITMFANGVIWTYLFTSLQGYRPKRVNHIWVFPIFFFTSTIFAEQSGFILQAYEVNIALLLLGITLINIFHGILQNKKWYYFLPAIICCTLTFSVYQAFVLLFASASSACFLIVYDRFNREHKTMSIRFCWIVIGKLISIFLLSFIMYTMINKIILAKKNLETSSYISGQILWKTMPPTECLKNIIVHIHRVLIGESLFYSLTFTIGCIGILIFTFIKFRKDISKHFMYMLALIFCIISPFLMTIFYIMCYLYARLCIKYLYKLLYI